MIVVEVVAIAFLVALVVAAWSVLSWLLFQAALKLWNGTRRRRVERESSEARQLLSSDELMDKVGDWYSTSELTASELMWWIDRLLQYPASRWGVKTAEQARKIVCDELERAVASSEAPPEGLDAVPDLPPGYFDGRVTAERSENMLGWVEWKRPGKRPIWVHRRRW